MFSEERLFISGETGIVTVVQAPRVILGNGNPVPSVFVVPRVRMVVTLMLDAASTDRRHLIYS